MKFENDINTIQNCIQFCSVYDFAFAGVEREDQCFCGHNAPTQYPMPDSECDSKCSGDQTQICGGNWAINVYSVPKKENNNNQSCAHIIEGSDQKYWKSNKYTK